MTDDELRLALDMHLPAGTLLPGDSLERIPGAPAFLLNERVGFAVVLLGAVMWRVLPDASEQSRCGTATGVRSVVKCSDLGLMSQTGPTMRNAERSVTTLPRADAADRSLVAVLLRFSPS